MSKARAEWISQVRSVFAGSRLLQFFRDLE